MKSAATPCFLVHLVTSGNLAKEKKDEDGVGLVIRCEKGEKIKKRAQKGSAHYQF